MAAGVQFNHDRLLDDPDPVYRLWLIASLNRAGEIRKQANDRKAPDGTASH